MGGLSGEEAWNLVPTPSPRAIARRIRGPAPPHGCRAGFEVAIKLGAAVHGCKVKAAIAGRQLHNAAPRQQPGPRVRYGFVNTCRLTDMTGVAVALDGAPLMRMSKTEKSPTGPAAAAADVRLRSIARRGKAEQSCYPQGPPVADPAKTAAALRLFWTPEEVAALSQ